MLPCTGTPAFSERTLADDYVAITPLGQVISKAETVAGARTAQLRYEAIDLLDMVVRAHQIAIVTARAEVKEQNWAKSSAGHTGLRECRCGEMDTG